MPPEYFPLRWESTGDQWWYASPIDFAAANGHYDLVRELLHFDTNLLIKLTSLRRIRRLETVWDDEEQFNDVAKCRSEVARKLLLECEPKNGHGHNSLIRAGYGGWLLYTAASAGDLDFVKELLNRDPLLVFGEGEYGVTDILYAAARSKNSDVFRVLLEFSIWSKCEDIGSVFKFEMINRAVHASARGGNVEILKELLADSCDVLLYRDVLGSTLLHTASGRGQTEVVKFLLETYDIVNSTDAQGNTALHVAAYNGHIRVVEILISSSPTSITSTNNYGDTFLHMTVAGFRTPGFRRVDRQIELLKQVVSGNIVNLEDIINVKNNDGRTALHVAVIENIRSDLVELLMSVCSIDLNIRDIDRMTPLDLLRQQPKSASSEILIKRLIAAGGISNYQDYMTRTALASHLKTHGIGGSPGTSFRIPDGEIIFYTGVEKEYRSTEKYETYSGELSQYSTPAQSKSGDSNRKLGLRSTTSAARRLKLLFGWALKKGRYDRDSLDSYNRSPVPLRERFSKCSLPNNKRVLGPSPSTKRKFSAGLMHGVLQVSGVRSPTSQFSESSWSSPISVDDDDDADHDDKSKQSNAGNVNNARFASINGEKQKFHRRQSSLSKILMNQYLCFGAQSLMVDEPASHTKPHQNYNHAAVT